MRRSDYEPPIAEDAIPAGILNPRYQIEDPSRDWPDDTELGPFDPIAPLVPFRPQPILAAEILGKEITGFSRLEGTYGMGGLGFFSLELGDHKLVVALRDAAQWIHVNGAMVEDSTWARHGRPRPVCDGVNEEDLRHLLVGKSIAHASFGQHFFSITLADGTIIGLEEDPQKRPPDYPHDLPTATRKQFGPSIDIRLNIFVMPNTTLWG